MTSPREAEGGGALGAEELAAIRERLERAVHPYTEEDVFYNWQLIRRLLDALEAAQRECSIQYVKGWNDGEADAEQLRVERDEAIAALRTLTAVLRVNWPESTSTAEFKKAQRLLIESGEPAVRHAP